MKYTISVLYWGGACNCTHRGGGTGPVDPAIAGPMF